MTSRRITFGTVKPSAVVARYRLHFKPALARADDYEKLMASMQAAFVEQGKDGIVKARAVEDQLMKDTWDHADYDPLPALRDVKIETLVIWGDQSSLADRPLPAMRILPRLIHHLACMR